MQDDLGGLPPGLPPGFTSTPGGRDAALRLAVLQGISRRALRALAWREGTAPGCLRAISSGAAGSDGDRAHLASTDAASILAALRSTSARFVGPDDEEYWPAFLRLADPPVGLFVRGAPIGLGEIRVAIVGARRPTSTGRDVATMLARTLALAGLGVVSGGAIGIDAAAHRGALDGAGRTVAVLGSGIDLLYPSSNASLFGDVLAGGGTIVSEYPPGVPAEPWRFPARNRLIAALSRGVVVVEGREPSGTRITAEHAIELGLDVFAVPGSVTSPLSATPLSLIRDGATMIRDAEDLLDDLGIEPATLPPVDPIGLPPDERAVLDALAAPMLPESVAQAVGIGRPQALAALVRLEMRGIVRGSGGRYLRTVRAADARAEGPASAP